MSEISVVSPAAGRLDDRVLGVVDQGRSGPSFLAQGGIHGNEPAGVEALARVLAAMREREIEVTGRFVAIAGNLGALADRRRFVHRDLNRKWLPDSIARLRAQDAAIDDAEDHEQRELLAVYDDYLSRSDPLVFADLHSSSADGPPFTCLSDTLANRRIALSLPVPLILGLEECIDGAVMDYFSRRGLPCIAIEGGRHDDPRTADNLEAALWLALVATGTVRAEQVDVDAHRRTLRAVADGLPPVVEIRHRQQVRPADDFRMRPGWISFEPVRRGEVLATTTGGAIAAPCSGRILLPLYQGLGDDGFFIARDVRPFWLWLSKVLRKVRAGRVLPWLPGVRRDPDDPDTLIADRRVARWLVAEVFHLLGYRRVRQRGGRLAFTRRRERP